ncbi:hypothetical protein B0T18DRAFT_89962 [Schizothecium vesticola]|uniref:Uncharacterized protein n=1 Tax=Schizothecium vesticola TaxID=314040 RepID=A0AA40KB36_9PEZI|nr:hypothetical protein B0T18DRAFT_89962 [Schizothecium vesticola]
MVPGGWAGVVLLFASGEIAGTVRLELPNLMYCQAGGAVAIPTTSTNTDGSSIDTTDANMGSQCQILCGRSILLPVSGTPLSPRLRKRRPHHLPGGPLPPYPICSGSSSSSTRHLPNPSSSPKEHSPSLQPVPEREMQRNLSTLAAGASHMSCFPNLGAQASHHRLREPRNGNSSTRSDGSTPQW